MRLVGVKSYDLFGPPCAPPTAFCCQTALLDKHTSQRGATRDQLHFDDTSGARRTQEGWTEGSGVGGGFSCLRLLSPKRSASLFSLFARCLGALQEKYLKEKVSKTQQIMRLCVPFIYVSVGRISSITDSNCLLKFTKIM